MITIRIGMRVMDGEGNLATVSEINGSLAYLEYEDGVCAWENIQFITLP
jgi:hypothetical protein